MEPFLTPLPLILFFCFLDAGKKALYVKLGCRGDWPEIMPPGWAPPLPDGRAAPQGTTKSMVL